MQQASCLHWDAALAARQQHSSSAASEWLQLASAPDDDSCSAPGGSWKPVCRLKEPGASGREQVEEWVGVSMRNGVHARGCLGRALSQVEAAP